MTYLTPKMVDRFFDFLRIFIRTFGILIFVNVFMQGATIFSEFPNELLSTLLVSVGISILFTAIIEILRKRNERLANEPTVNE